jgi:hypothetical protein
MVFSVIGASGSGLVYATHQRRGDRPCAVAGMAGAAPLELATPGHSRLRRLARVTRSRRAVRACGHFPNETAALKCVYLAVMSLDPTGQGRRRWTMRWKPALNAFEMTFEGRLTPARK